MKRLRVGLVAAGLLATGGCAAEKSECESLTEPLSREIDRNSGITVQYLYVDRPGSSIHDVAISPDGGVWFVDTWRSCLGVIDPADNQWREIPALDRDARPHGIDVDGNGTVWYAATGVGKIGRFDPGANLHREYVISEQPIDPHTVLVIGNRVWFTAPRSNVYGYVDSGTEEVLRLEAPSPGSSPYGLAAAPDGSIWITLEGTNHVGRIAPGTDELMLFELSEDARPRGISVDHEGMVWYTDRVGQEIGRLDPETGGVRSFPATTDRAFPLSIVTGSEGSVWYYEEGTGRLVRIDPACNSHVAIGLDRPGTIVRDMVLDSAAGGILIALGELSGFARVSMMDVKSCGSS